MVKLLRDGTLCEIDRCADDPEVRTAFIRWYVQRTGGWETGPVSDERLSYLLDYFENVEVGNDDERFDGD